jgi:S-adenosylmethionine-diacylgycerolhomoserine-N-methlytransferase
MSMRIVADARVLAALVRGMGGRGTHAERLQRFYAPQAAGYDGFRERLLQGRERLTATLPIQPGAFVVELGAGTGRNVDLLGARAGTAGSIVLVDLCPALLAHARTRHGARANVHTELADATTYRPPAPADCVYFSYALTMIPDWRGAIANAVGMLKPGGTLGVVDFHISARHSAIARAFWPRWFRHDGVHLSAAHLPLLLSVLEPVVCEERMAVVPYLPGCRVPYYVFTGRKRAATVGRR